MRRLRNFLEDRLTDLAFFILGRVGRYNETFDLVRWTLADRYGFDEIPTDEFLLEYMRERDERLDEHRHQLTTVLEMLNNEEVDRARRYIHAALYVESEVSRG